MKRWSDSHTQLRINIAYPTPLQALVLSTLPIIRGLSFRKPVGNQIQNMTFCEQISIIPCASFRCVLNDP